jgi:chromosome segregation ATPase
MQNIFQQVFASANATHEFKVKVKTIEPAVTVVTDPGAPASEVAAQIPARGRKKSQRASKDIMELQSATNEMETRLQQMAGQLKQSEASLAKIREHNLILEKRNSDLENLIERLRQAAITTALQANQMHNRFEEEEKESNETWKFRVMELQFEIEELKRQKRQ